MNPKLRIYLFALLALWLSGCRREAQPAPTAATESAVDLATVETIATAEQRPPATATAPVGTGDEAEPTSIAPELERAPLPAPTLFTRAWEDPAPYEAGLTDAAAEALLALPERTIYHLDLTLAADLRAVSGVQEVRFVNNEDLTLNELFFHLYPNLLGGQITVTEVVVDGEPAPTRLLAQDSILAVSLATPLPPGEALVVSLTFTVQVPTEGGRNYGVFVIADEVLALAHFYPQVAVHDDEGWNIEPPSANADPTYADAAFYLVRIRAASDQVLVTSGVSLDQTEGEGQQIATVAIGPARDFYIASSARYQMVSQQVGETTVNVFGFSDTEARMAAVLDYATGALGIMSRLVAPYPYTELDVAPTVNLALGVEYPGTVVLNSRLYDPDARFGALPSAALLESTVAHEVVHQWFYNVVGNDQLDEPWLDESLTQYATLLYFQERYDATAAANFRQSWLDRWARVEEADIPIGLPAGRYNGAEYGGIVYGRGPLFFETLAEEMGPTTFAAFLRDYYQQNEWGIATGAELQLLAEIHCDCQLEGLFAEWVGQP